MNDIQYGAYRTAMKLRAVQKACHRKLREWNEMVVVGIEVHICLPSLNLRATFQHSPHLFLTLGHHCLNVMVIGNQMKSSSLCAILYVLAYFLLL